MATPQVPSTFNIPMVDKSKDPVFYDQDVHVWDPSLTTYNMRKDIKLVLITFGMIGDHNI